jgi:hypothetical protein
MPSGTNAGRALLINAMKKQGGPVPSVSTVQTFQTENANRALYISQLKKQGMPVPAISTVQTFQAEPPTISMVKTFQTGRAPPHNTALIAPRYQGSQLRPPPVRGILNAQSALSAPPQGAAATTNAFDLLDRYMTYIVPDANARPLGQQNMHFNIFTVLAYWQSSQAQAHWGSYQIIPVFNRAGKLVFPWYAFRVSGIQMGTGFPVDLYFWGEVPGNNTVVSRYQFWKLYLLSSIRDNFKNRLSGATGQAFVPVADEHGVLTEKPIIH